AAPPWHVPQIPTIGEYNRGFADRRLLRQQRFLLRRTSDSRPQQHQHRHQRDSCPHKSSFASRFAMLLLLPYLRDSASLLPTPLASHPSLSRSCSPRNLPDFTIPCAGHISHPIAFLLENVKLRWTLRRSSYSTGTPGMATIPAIRNNSWYSSSFREEMISRTFLS